MGKRQFFLLILLMAAGIAAGWFLFNYTAPKVENLFGIQSQTTEKADDDDQEADDDQKSDDQKSDGKKKDPSDTQSVKWHPQNLKRRYSRHGAEFPEYKTMKEYGDAALEFFKNPPEGTQFKYDRNGDRLYYHEKSNTFGITTKKGIPKNFSRPKNGKSYWKNL